MRWPPAEELKRVARQAASDGLTPGQRAAALVVAHSAEQGLDRGVSAVADAVRGKPSGLRALQTFCAPAVEDRSSLLRHLENFDVGALHPELQHLNDLVAAADAAERALQTQLAKVAKTLVDTAKKEVPR